MANLVIEKVLSINNYDPNDRKPILVCNLVADTVADLPNRDQTTFYLGIGSKADVIYDGSVYKMQSDGTWVLQEAGTAGYTKAEVDQLIQDTKDYADGEITGAIMDLDVPAVGGSTKYVYSVSQADGLLVAEAYTSDSSPTTGSTKLVQSGGVKTYVDTEVQGLENDVPGIAETRVYGQGTRIPTGSNLNDYWQAGSYHILTAGDATNITNKPNDPNFNVGSVRARVLVFQFSGDTVSNARCFQVYIPARTDTSTGTGCFYIRYRYISNDTPGWTVWSRIDGTPV